MMKTSYGEHLCRGLLKRWFPCSDVIYNHRPVWLKNPDTGRNLELDIYYPNLKLAVEFNGSQHRLLLQRRKDFLKKVRCDEMGVLLLSVYHPMDLFKCKSLVRKHTGIKPPSGRKDEKFLLELKMYSVKMDVSSEWYDVATRESTRAEIEKSISRKLRRSITLQNRRRARIAVWILSLALKDRIYPTMR